MDALNVGSNRKLIEIVLKNYAVRTVVPYLTKNIHVVPSKNPDFTKILSIWSLCSFLSK